MTAHVAIGTITRPEVVMTYKLVNNVNPFNLNLSSDIAQFAIL